MDARLCDCFVSSRLGGCDGGGAGGVRQKTVKPGYRITCMRKTVLVFVLMATSISFAAEVPPLRARMGEMAEGNACVSDPSQTYTLYLPSGYTNGRRWPVLLIFDPRGRSVLAAELFREAADEFGWILVSSNDTRSDGPMETNIKALDALWPEIHSRLPADFDRIYAAGFSGGAAVAYLLAKSTEEIAGIVACGGRMLPAYLEGNTAAIFSTAGNTDFNYNQMRDVDTFLDRQGNSHRLVYFDGDHTWMPPQVARQAVEWFELIAMQRKTREFDEGFVASRYQQEMDEAADLASGGNALDAARRYEEIERTYKDLLDIGGARRAATALRKSPEAKVQKKEEKGARSFEERCGTRLTEEISELRFADLPPSVSRLARDLGLDDMKRLAEKRDAEGLAAQRCLNLSYVRFSFYLPQDISASGDSTRLAVSYEIATMIRDDNPVVWYNLACARALLGREGPAVEAFQRSLDLGFNRVDLIRTDPDLDSLRDRDDFKKIVATLAE